MCIFIFIFTFFKARQLQENWRQITAQQKQREQELQRKEKELILQREELERERKKLMGEVSFIYAFFCYVI